MISARVQCGKSLKGGKTEAGRQIRGWTARKSYGEIGQMQDVAVEYISTSEINLVKLINI